VYRGVPLLTNQPDERTHLVAVRSLEQEVSVGEYQRLAHATIDALLRRGRTPVVVGGTGLYLRAALAELGVPPAAPRGVRERWERAYDRLGPEDTYALLARRDPAAAASLHPNDRRRVVRALELADTGHSLRPSRARLWSDETRHPTLIVGLDIPRDVLARRIEARTRAMFAGGVELEVRRAMAGPLSATASQMIGLREVHELPREEAIAAISLRTRQYAAYQRKWMRRIPGLASVRADRPPGEIADDILEMARCRERVPAARAG
jgi:tRNA dimethylallyltransferase